METAFKTIIITGGRDSGKTTWCRRNLRTPDTAGLLLVKVYGPGGEIEGYDAVLLEDGGRLPLMRAGFRPDGTSAADPAAESAGAIPSKDTGRIGRYVVSLPAVVKANRWIIEAWTGAKERVLIDEVGRLELEGGGFAPALRHIFGKPADSPAPRSPAPRSLFLVIRDRFLGAVLDRFSIQPAGVWTVEAGEKCPCLDPEKPSTL